MRTAIEYLLGYGSQPGIYQLLTISCNGVSEAIQIHLSSPNGQIIQQIQAKPHAEIQVDLAALPAGLYYVTIRSKSKTEAFKVIKV